MSVLARAEAKKIIDHYGITKPAEINLEIISAGLGVFVEEKSIEGSEGRITHNGKNGFIVVNSNISYKPQKRFVVAHELGHFKLHSETKLFNCNKEALFNWQQKNSIEGDANTFAAELIMPENIFRSFITKKIFSLDLIKETASAFETSITSTAFRYSDIGNHPIAIVFCKDWTVKWSNFNKDFPYKFIPNGVTVSNNSYSYDFFAKKPVPSTPEEIPIDAWFTNSNNYQPNKVVFEQCFPFPDFNSILVLLWEK